MKKWRTKAKEEKKGALTAIEEHLSKVFSNKKQFKNWLVQKFDSLVDKIDPMKALVILSLTGIIKTGIEWSEEAIASLAEPDIFKAVMKYGLGIFGGLVPPSEAALTQQEQIQKAFDTPQAEIIEWALSFIAAYMIVEHGDALITAGGNILGVAKGLVGIIGGVVVG